MANIFEQPLEISQLLASPFLAAVNADSAMAFSTVEFIRDLGFENPKENGNLGDAIMLEFNYEVTTTTNLLEETTSVNTFKIPLLAITTPPSLRIQRVEVDLVLEVNQLMEETSRATNGPKLYRALGRLSSDTKVETNSFANYKVKMVAESVGENEALAEIMKALTNTAHEHLEQAYVRINTFEAKAESIDEGTKITITFTNPMKIELNSTIRLEFDTNITILTDQDNKLNTKNISEDSINIVSNIVEIQTEELIALENLNTIVLISSNLPLTIQLSIVNSHLVTDQKSNIIYIN